MKSTYFDDLEIENYFESNATMNIPTEAGLVKTKPQGIDISTAPRMNADGKLRDRLKAFVQSDKGKKIIKILIAGGLAVAFGPELIAALGPVLPAMKTLLMKKGISAKGPMDIIKKFTDTQLKMADGEKKDPKKIIQAIFKSFKDAKDRRANGTASPLDETILNVADTTIQKISDGTLSVSQAVEGDLPGGTTTTGKTETTTTEKKTGIDMKIVLVVLVAVFIIFKK